MKACVGWVFGKDFQCAVCCAEPASMEFIVMIQDFSHKRDLLTSVRRMRKFGLCRKGEAARTVVLTNPTDSWRTLPCDRPVAFRS